MLLSFQDRAKELGVKGQFDTMVKAFEKAEKETQQKQRQSQTLIENWTNFTGKYDSMKCGSWLAADNGIRTFNKDYSNEVIVCYHPIMPIGRMRNLETGEEQIRLAYKRNHRWTEIAVPKDIISSASKIVTDHPFWIHEVSRSFQQIISGDDPEGHLDYEYDFNYDYTMPYGSDLIWTVDHFAPCEFLLTVFGPVTDPMILINGHPYQVYTSLDENDYMQINSRNNTIVKYRSDGVRQDIYDSRAKQQSVFDLIAPGNIRVVWPGSFGFDLKLYCERSEPKCKTKGS